MSNQSAELDQSQVNFPHFPPVPQRNEFKLEFLFNYTMNMPKDKPPTVIGEIGEGHLAIVPDEGIRIRGPKINGNLSLHAVDYLTVRRDGIGIHKVSSVMVTDDGAKITFIYEGRSDWGPDGYQKAVEGKIPEGLRIKCAPHMQTSHPDYLWVNRLQCVEIGDVFPQKGYASCDVYAVV